MTENEKESIGCIMVIVAVLLMVSLAIVAGHFFGVAFGIVAFLVAAAVYLLACVAVAYKNGSLK